MKSEDELKQMFEAQRKVNQRLAPKFGDVEKSASSDLRHSSEFPSSKFLAPAALSALSLLAVAAIVVLYFVNTTSKPPVDPTPNEIRQLNQACNSVLAEIDLHVSEAPADSVDGRSATESAKELNLEWPTTTDSLIPFSTLSSNTK